MSEADSLNYNKAILTTATKLYTSVLTAQDNVLENQLEYIHSVWKKLQTEVELFRSLGGTI